MSQDDFLSRWSRRKHQARKGEAPAEPAPLPAAPVAEAPDAEAQKPAVAADSPPLPPVESLTKDSDFTAFMKPEVEPGLRNEALKTLFSDPQFNVMDGLDVYIDDYSKPDPLPAGWLEKMTQVARLGAFEPPTEDDTAEPPIEGGEEKVADAAQPDCVAAPKDPPDREDKNADT